MGVEDGDRETMVERVAASGSGLRVVGAPGSLPYAAAWSCSAGPSVYVTCELAGVGRGRLHEVLQKPPISPRYTPTNSFI